MNFCLYLAFLTSFAVILLYLRKKQMKIAGLVFLAVGIFISLMSGWLMLAQWVMGDTPVTGSSQWIGNFVSYVLFVCTIFYNVALISISVATLILSVFAVKKLVAALGNKPKTEQISDPADVLVWQLIFSFSRKIFILHCRLNN